jgi:hypothetical protein
MMDNDNQDYMFGERWISVVWFKIWWKLNNAFKAYMKAVSEKSAIYHNLEW